MKSSYPEPHRRHRRAGAVWRWCAMLCAALCAAGAPGSLPARELLVVSTHFEKVYERDAEGMIVGLGPEIVRQLAQRMGHTVRFELYPWARAQALVAGGQADILAAPYRTPERQRIMAFSRLPFFQDRLVFYKRVDGSANWQGDYGALANQRVAVLNGWAYGAAFDQARPQLRVSVTNTVESGLRMLAHRHVQLFASTRRDTEMMLGRLGLVGVVTGLPMPIDVQDAYFAFPPGDRHDGLRRAFDAEFQRLVDSGEWRKLLLRHGVDQP